MRKEFEVKKQYFTSLPEIYKCRFNALLATAHRSIYNKNFAVDAVHDAFAKATEYFQKNPERKIRERILHFLVIKACKRYNKYNREVYVGLLQEDPKEID